MTLMNLDLSGKTALITASVTGIGLATAQGLAACGARVWINGRSEDRLATAAGQIRARVPGAEVMTVRADVATAEGCRAVTEAVTDTDILINMAGGTDRLAPFEELTDEDWQYQYDFNVMSAVRLTRHYLPMFRRKEFGRIIFMTSEAGMVTPTWLPHYGVAKAGVIRLSRCVAENFHGAKDVTANCVSPGGTMSEWVHREAKDTPIEEFERAHFAENEATSLLARFAKADEVANMIVYLCSPAATATRGAVLRADGGPVRSD
ncbi:MAG: SDR family NAD(P)-dependent oxidoreductase [Tropicimonas sp.]|uniref:SDR family NAD(P)-dependent oxidoreductase n=1 Tax=Tropicimonas sp. TaxID=2067044 RepID=UPI003A85E431